MEADLAVDGHHAAHVDKRAERLRERTAHVITQAQVVHSTAQLLYHDALTASLATASPGASPLERTDHVQPQNDDVAAPSSSVTHATGRSPDSAARHAARSVDGHVDPASTYWYLEAVPELLELIAGRLEQLPEGLS